MSFDPITLAMAKPKVVDLTQFTDGTDTLNDVISMKTMESLQSGGGLKGAMGIFAGLRKELSTEKQIFLSMNNSGIIMKTPVFLSTYNGVALQCSFVGQLFLEGVVFSQNITIVFDNNPASETISVYVTAKPVT